MLMILPAIGTLGALFVDESNLVLLFTILAIATVFVLGVVSKRFLPHKLFPWMVLAIAITLLFHTTLVSHYIYGSDIHSEYYSFELTRRDAFWNPSAYYSDPRFGRFNSMLSITILPTIYSNLMNMDPTWVFKIIFPLVFSLVPLVLFKLWRIGFKSKIAFISAFFFMSELTFYSEMPGLTRQMIAELFFVLLLYVLISKKLTPIQRKIFFVIFSSGLILSHYAMALIFLFIIFVTWSFLYLKERKGSNISLSLVCIFFVIMFSWYIYTSSSASFDSIVDFGNHLYYRFSGFLNLASREEGVIRGLGLEPVSHFWKIPSRIFAYATEFLIVVGFVGLMTGRVKENFPYEYKVFQSLAIGLLIMGIVLPGFASSLNMTRLYHITLIFLAPFLILGCRTLIQLIARKRLQLYVTVLALLVITPYFMFQTGFVYEVTGSDVWSVPLSGYRMDYVRLYRLGYVDDASVFGAEWLSNSVNLKNVKVYADSISRYKVLSSYGRIYEGNIRVISNVTRMENVTILYLSRLNVDFGIVAGSYYTWNTSDLAFLFEDLNKVYSNGGSEVFTSVDSNY